MSPASPSTPICRSSPSCPQTPGGSGRGSFSARSPPPTGTTTTQQARASRSSKPPARSAGSRRCCYPGRPRPVRETQRPGRPRDRRPVAPAGGRGRDAPGGAVGRTGAQPIGQGHQGRCPGGRHHRRSQGGRSASPRTSSGVTTSMSPARAWASPPSCTILSRTSCGRRPRAGTRTPSSS